MRRTQPPLTGGHSCDSCILWMCPTWRLRRRCTDYYRASEQRSRWARKYLLVDGEAELYDRNLVDAWQRHFMGCMAEVDGDTGEAEKCTLGRRVFRWSREYQKPFRNRDELWLSSGSFQMLANEIRVGWHPDYKERLSDSTEEG